MNSPAVSANSLKQRGNACLQSNQLPEAKKYFLAASKLEPLDADVWHKLGSIYAMQGKFTEAKPCCRKALALQPDHGPANYNLGVVLQRTGETEAAIDSYRTALKQLPRTAVIHSSLGYALWEAGNLEESLASCHMALSIDPNLAEAWNNLSITQRSLGQLEQAVESCQKAIDLRPGYAEACNNLGNCLSDLFQYHDSKAAYKQAIQLDPSFDQAHVGLGRLYSDNGECQQAVSEYRRAIEINANNADAHFNLAWTLLLLGEFNSGWREYEWRLRLNVSEQLTQYPKPRWDGKSLKGKTIFIQSEQGFGDAIQFIRYLPLMKQLGGKIILECHPALHALFRSRPEVDQIIPKGKAPPEFDCHIPLASLPGIFNTSLASMPSDIPYLSPPHECPPDIRTLIDKHCGKRRIGLVWSGNPEFRRNHLRSCPLALFSGLLGNPDNVFFSLQKGNAANDIVTTGVSDRLTPLGDKLHSFADTAAVLSELDLLISTDTSVPHLAGALGRPVWLLLSYAADWRWLRDRGDSPWYPTMKLFRQPAPNDWESVLRQVEAALEA